MNKSKVFRTSFRTGYFGESIPAKLKRLAKTAGIGDIDMRGRLVAIKTCFGELGNVSYLRPNYVKAAADLIRELGGTPFVTDCNTMYPGRRKNAVEHLYCAWENGFTPLSAGCPVIIGDGLKGTDDIAVPVPGGEYTKSALIGRAVMDADIFISLSHFKGHELTGFGGAIKNIGMGCGSRAGKKDMHSGGKPVIDAAKCRGCRRCLRECANNGLVFDAAAGKMRVDTASCAGCGRCLGACSFDAISFSGGRAGGELGAKMAEYALAVTAGRPCFHLALAMDISPYCDCHSENDAPVLPNIGMFASFDPVALDQACADACLEQSPLPDCALTDRRNEPGFTDKHDHFKNISPDSDWQSPLIHGEKIGLGSRNYELIEVK